MHLVKHDLTENGLSGGETHRPRINVGKYPDDNDYVRQYRTIFLYNQHCM